MTVSGFRQQLDALLSRFDEESFVALANRGLLRRAQKDLEKLSIAVSEETAQELTVTFGEHRIRFDARGPAGATCSCPASGVCQHILAAAMGLQRLAATEVAKITPAEAVDPLSPMRDGLMRMTHTELTKHAGKAGYRWAWQFVHDMTGQDAVSFSGEQHVVIAFKRPRMSLRYMGGEIDALIADVDIKQIEKYRVAAVLAFQRAHGAELVAPEPIGKARSDDLDLGMDHRLAATSSESVEHSRQRLRESARQLLIEAIELGLAHLSAGIQDRFATLAVWAQGAEYYRLALLMRRVADHVEMLLERAGGADEHRLLDELTIAYAIVSALDAAASRGLSPSHLVGHARSRYEASSSLELWGLGAQSWRSPSGYRGLTMLFWSPSDATFFTCTDARPETMRGFDPRARYKSAGPWGGLGAPAQVTGRRLTLTGAQISAGGRLSSAESTTATVLPDDLLAPWTERLSAWSSWSALLSSRGTARHSLLSEPKPKEDWVLLRPAWFGKAVFDEARQTLSWPLIDENGQRLMAELVYDEHTSHAIQRVEAHAEGANDVSTIVVARMRRGVSPLVVEPLSLVLGGERGSAAGREVDALHFDEEAKMGVTAQLLARWARRLSPTREAQATALIVSRSPPALNELQYELRRWAEKGVADDQRGTWLSRIDALQTKASSIGLAAFSMLRPEQLRAGDAILRSNYVALQYAEQFGSQSEALG